MKKGIRFVILTALLSVLYLSPALADEAIKPAGEKIGSDKHGNAIYQINANGIKIGYKIVGTSGEPLLMIMGLGGNMELWPEVLIKKLSKKYQLILPDNRGMGRSTSNAEPFTCKLFADDEIALLDSLKIKKINVLGYSMGSSVTQKLLYEYPDRIKKAVIYATSTDGSNVAAGLHAHAAASEAIKKKMEAMDPKWEETVKRQVEATSAWKTPMEKVPEVKNQVMFIVGTADTTVGTESSKTLAAAIPGAWLVQFKNGTHGLMRETPADFAKIVLAFLEIDETVEIKEAKEPKK